MVILHRDIWDDYGYKTMFDARLFLSHDDDSVDLGAVKIMKRGQHSGPTELAPAFDRLSEDYCSLGQAFSYYEALNSLPEHIRSDILYALRDIAADRSIREAFALEGAMTSSLLRFGNAELALRDAITLFEGSSFKRNAALIFGFETNVGGDDFQVTLAFADRPPLPGRINVIVGYNGCGKTQLLANLAALAHADLITRGRPDFQRRHGNFLAESQNQRFSSVIAVSYSAFDTFDLPGKTQQERDRLASTGDVSGYVYCGLRRNVSESPHDQNRPAPLKSVLEIQDEIRVALERVNSTDRLPILVDALAPLLQEPSFRRIGLSDATISDLDAWSATFPRLSTGHKLVLNILVQLTAHLEPGSLVLIDEPETHLHPPLLAALIKSINIALDRFDSVALVATHSPVLLQEVPRRYVRILQRFGSINQISSPEIEIFGENVGLLTRHVFNLDSSATDYHSILRSLQRQYSLAEILELFNGELSAQSLSYIMSLEGDLNGE
uniref:AAA family ATPase n=1 Tax=Nonomuraea pusilla TaxID=46177 RepID=UPI00159CB3C9|nr:AAA family ATPase [Nonomuraea pusilla]